MLQNWAQFSARCGYSTRTICSGPLLIGRHKALTTAVAVALHKIQRSGGATCRLKPQVWTIAQACRRGLCFSTIRTVTSSPYVSMVVMFFASELTPRDRSALTAFGYYVTACFSFFKTFGVPITHYDYSVHACICTQGRGCARAVICLVGPVPGLAENGTLGSRHRTLHHNRWWRRRRVIKRGGAAAGVYAKKRGGGVTRIHGWGFSLCPIIVI